MGWFNPVKMPFKAVKLPHPHPYYGFLREYGYPAYTHISEAKQFCKEKLLERALIGYLVSYNSTNRFCT
jgi:hypothetical protein